MKLYLTIIANSSQSKIVSIEELDHKVLMKVKLVSQPEKNKANKELIKLLSDHFQLKKTSFIITQGKTNNKKIVEIV